MKQTNSTISEKSFEFVGKKVNKRWFKEMEERKIFHKGERIIAAVKGTIESGIIPLRGDRSTYRKISLGSATVTHVRDGLLSLTNQRVILYMPKMLGRYEFEAYPIDQISSIQFTKGIFRGRIQITAFNDYKVIKWVDNEGGKTITDMIQKAVQDAKNKKLIIHTPKQSQKSDGDVLKVLKLRYAKGEITKKEYTKLKKELV